MKTRNMLWAALSMTAALVMTACSSDNDITETPAAPQAQKTIPYTVTVSDAAATRATVSDDPTNRQLYFATGDKLYITGTDIQGVLDLQAGDEGKATGATFSGELTYSGSGSPADDLSLTATLVSAQQTVGTQVSVDDAGAVTVNYPTTAYCATISDAVQQYSRLTGTSTYGARAFTLTQQTAFLNFVITFEDGTATGTALSAVVNNNSSDICTANVTTTTESEKVVAKFVLPVASGTVLSSAKVTMGSKAALAISDATLTGKVYNVTRTQAAAGLTLDLATVTEDTTVGDGYTVIGTLGANVKISIADGATVTLDGVTINGANKGSYPWAGITCLGDATIILSGTNTVKGFQWDYPGIHVPENKTLTIDGSGSLTASSNGGGCGIGGGYNIACGNIVIADGTINATGGNAAGIGGGYQSSCGTISITGGNITANGGASAAGIGSGDGGSCVNISITGGTVTATGGTGAAGIGSCGDESSCGNISITGGTVAATGGMAAAGIGSGFGGSCGTVTITNGVTSVTATKGNMANYSIGAGMSGECGTVTIGGTKYWENNAAVGDGATYLAQATIVYPAPAESRGQVFD